MLQGRVWRTGPGPPGGPAWKQCPKAPRREAGGGRRVGPYHTVQATHGPGLRLQLAPEELAEVAVVVQVLHSGLLHVHPESPDVQAVDGPAQPVRQLHLVEAAPGPRQQARWHRLVQGHLQVPRAGECATPCTQPQDPPTGTSSEARAAGTLEGFVTWWSLTRNQTELPSLYTQYWWGLRSDSHSSGVSHFLQCSHPVSWLGTGIQGSDVVTQVAVGSAAGVPDQHRSSRLSVVRHVHTPKCTCSACPEHRGFRAEVLGTDTSTPRASQSTQPSLPEAPPGEGTAPQSDPPAQALKSEVLLWDLL